MTDRDDELMAVDQVPGQQASQSSLDELNQDAGDSTNAPGSGDVAGENEPSPTGAVGQSDHPVSGKDPQSG
jgi:hypothetical protein